MVGADVGGEQLLVVLLQRRDDQHHRDAGGLGPRQRRDDGLIVDVDHHDHVDLLRDGVVDLLRLHGGIVVRREVGHLHAGLGGELGEGRGPGADVRIGVGGAEQHDALALRRSHGVAPGRQAHQQEREQTDHGTHGHLLSEGGNGKNGNVNRAAHARQHC